MPLKILTVDDSKTIRMIVKKAFKAFDCELFEGENGVEGLTIASREKPDLIILDITMPIMDGVEMLGKLKKEPALRDIPVIMLTAESGKENVLKIVKMGVKDYMVKPFKGDQLIERVTKFIKLDNKSEEEAAPDKSDGYFSVDGDVQILKIPSKVTRPIMVAIEGSLTPKIKETVNLGTNIFILDLRKVTEINVSLIKLIILVISNCEKFKIQTRILGTTSLGNELKEFQETSNLTIFESLQKAKGS